MKPEEIQKQIENAEVTIHLKGAKALSEFMAVLDAGLKTHSMGVIDTVADIKRQMTKKNDNAGLHKA